VSVSGSAALSARRRDFVAACWSGLGPSATTGTAAGSGAVLGR
jgi:hypothetical protein